MISSLEAAKFIIDYSMKQKSAINLIYLQNIMYLISLDWFHLNFEKLYDDQCIEIPLGVRYLKVFDYFCCYGGMSIRQEFEIKDFYLEKFFIKEIKKYQKFSINEISKKVKNALDK